MITETNSDLLRAYSELWTQIIRENIMANATGTTSMTYEYGKLVPADDKGNPLKVDVQVVYG